MEEVRVCGPRSMLFYSLPRMGGCPQNLATAITGKLRFLCLLNGRA